MTDNTRKILFDAVGQIAENYEESQVIRTCGTAELPDRAAVIGILNDLRVLMFPGYFDRALPEGVPAEYHIGCSLSDIYDRLHTEVRRALTYKCNDGDVENRAEEICAAFFEKLPDIQKTLFKDVKAGYTGDPAAASEEEIICCYPGFYAVFVYRIAHLLYESGVPLIPRIMTEHAHGKTGIDINSGAKIGEYFFIDHGTGVVIGETTVIGNNVKIYQGVTLGALSTRGGQKLSGTKRHPTVEDNVTIYAGATVLGGATVIGEGSVIGGNTVITSSVGKNIKVSAKAPELNFKEATNVE